METLQTIESKNMASLFSLVKSYHLFLQLQSKLWCGFSTFKFMAKNQIYKYPITNL